MLDTYLFLPDHKYFSRPTRLLSLWRNNHEWTYAHSSVTSPSAATLNEMTDFFLLLSVTVTTQSWWNRGTWCNPLKHLHTSSLIIPNQPFSSGTAGIPLLYIHGGKRSCPELAIIFVLFVPKLEKFLPEVWKLLCGLYCLLFRHLYHLKARLVQTDEFTELAKNSYLSGKRKYFHAWEAKK